MNIVAIKGSLVAIVTPMHVNGELDLELFNALIDFHVAEGTDGIVVVGTTGESPTVDFDEHHLLIETAVERAAGRVPIIAGKQSIYPFTRRTRARMQAFQWFPITTSRPRKACINTSRQ